MSITGANLVNGRWQIGTPSFDAFDPSTGQKLAPGFSEAGREEVNSALAAATEAFQEMRSADSRWPAKLLEGIAGQIERLGDELLDRTGLATALPRPRLVSERARTVGQLRMFAQAVRDGSWLTATIDTADPKRQPMPKPDIRRMFVGRGPVVVFGASNFPLAFGTAGGDTASAIAAGNPVIVKGHPSHPGTNELMASAVLAALKDLKLPAGLFSLLQGRSHDLSGWLVEHPATAAVGFTGSRRAGRALFDIAARRSKPIPVYAEMGSVNPLIVLPNALAARGEAIAKDAANSLLLGGGQFCTKPGLILTLGDAGKLLNALGVQIAAAPVITMLNQLLRDSFVERVGTWTAIPGVTVRAVSKPQDYASVSASLFETTASVFLKHPELHDEAFGPTGLVVRCDRVQEIQQVLAAIGGNLTGTIHADPGDGPQKILQLLEGIVGRIVINGYPTGVEVCHAMVHGGPYPATTDPATTSVGTAAITRFARMIAYQNAPDELLPAALQNANPLGIERTVNGRRTADPIQAI